MLKKELENLYSNLCKDVRDLNVELRDLKTESSRNDDIARQSLRKLADLRVAIGAVVSMNFPEAELDTHTFFPGNSGEWEKYQAALKAQPEELCLLRHLYSLAQ